MHLQCTRAKSLHVDMFRPNNTIFRAKNHNLKQITVHELHLINFITFTTFWCEYLFVGDTWSDNKVRELIAVKLLHTSLHRSRLQILLFGSYAPMPAPSSHFKTIKGIGFVEWPSELPLYYTWWHQCHQNAFLSIFPLSSGTEKSHWGLNPVNLH